MGSGGAEEQRSRGAEEMERRASLAVGRERLVSFQQCERHVRSESALRARSGTEARRSTHRPRPHNLNSRLTITCLSASG